MKLEVSNSFIVLFSYLASLIIMSWLFAVNGHYEENKEFVFVSSAVIAILNIKLKVEK